MNRGVAVVAYLSVVAELAYSIEIDRVRCGRLH
jgi:hypothetical protein